MNNTLFFEITRWSGEAVGVFGAIGLTLFIIDYARITEWKINAQGRAVMYLAGGLLATILFLVLHSFVRDYEWRWITEIIVYTPLALACWNLRQAMRKSMGIPSVWLFMSPRKTKKSKSDNS